LDDIVASEDDSLSCLVERSRVALDEEQVGLVDTEWSLISAKIE
jgi:hypothetical protein